jgi:hypothetical protein
MPKVQLFCILDLNNLSFSAEKGGGQTRPPVFILLIEHLCGL